MEFVSGIDEKEFNSFVDNNNGSFLQTTEWARVKAASGWGSYRVGVRKGGALVAASMILTRKLPLVGRYIFYCPAGFLIDYTDKEMLAFFTAELRKFVKSHGAILVKIDPTLKYTDRDIKGNLIGDGNRRDDIMENLTSAGFRHLGFPLDFQGVQPRFTFHLDLDRTEEEIHKSFEYNTRYKIRVAERYNVYITEGGREDLKVFADIMNETGERDGFITRPLVYFQKMYDELQPAGRLKLYLAKVKLETGEEKVLSVAITVRTGIKAWYLYGASISTMREFMSPFAIQWESIKWAKSAGCKIYDFGGFSGDLSPENPLHGLYRFKKAFTPDFIEYIGEFDLVISKVFYFIWTKAFPLFRDTRKKIVKFIRRR